MHNFNKTIRFDLVKLIRHLILSREYVPGQRILEEDIVKRTGVSRTPIREVFLLLDQEGLIKIKSHRGVYVATFTRSEIIDLISIESVMEGLVASLATVNITDQEISVLEEMNSRAKATISPNSVLEDFYRYDSSFHSGLIQSCGSPTLITMLEKQLPQIYLCRYYVIKGPDRFQQSIREHQHIINCIKQRDSTSAEKAARRHLENVLQDFISTDSIQS